MRVTVIIVYMLLHRSSFWQYRFGMMLTSQAVAVCSLMALSLVRSVTGVTAALMGLGVFTGFNYFASLYYSSAGAHEHRRGFSSGMHEATLGLGFGIGAIGGGILGTFAGVRAPYILAACVVLALAVVQTVFYLRNVRPLRKSESPADSEV